MPGVAQVDVAAGPALISASTVRSAVVAFYGLTMLGAGGSATGAWRAA
ncbi:MAG TPA: hypothetical protein VMF55_05025 [Solirubrobacterales bacterium]|nr:hypothetical protein [Solirubrobacterales bacterium]